MNFNYVCIVFYVEGVIEINGQYHASTNTSITRSKTKLKKFGNKKYKTWKRPFFYVSNTFFSSKSFSLILS